MTDDKAFKRAVRKRMRATGEKYTSARRVMLRDAVSDNERVCAYCAQDTLTGRERPEHALAAALRAGMIVTTVCDPCNAWAGIEIDQPFLDDPFIRMYRAKHDLRDPRRSGARPVSDPLRHGFTDEGLEVIADEEWQPRIRGRILQGDNPDEFRIVAGDEEELRKLTERVVRRAQADGRTASIGEPEHVSDQPHVHGTFNVRPWVWRRALAKVALACGSVAYPPDWRLSGDATLLRTWMRDREALPYDHCPMSDIPEALRSLVPAPSHAMFFQAGEDATILTVVLFGELAFRLPMETTGRPVPDVAWFLDVSRPTSDGRTTFQQLLARAALRSAA